MEFARTTEPISFDRADELADRFEAILNDHGIKIETGSPLENGVLLLHEMKVLHDKVGQAWYPFS